MSGSTAREQVTQSLASLSETELQQVADYVTFLKFRARLTPPLVVDPTQLGTLYGEFAEEDRALAEEGMAEYRGQLRVEDTL